MNSFIFDDNWMGGPDYGIILRRAQFAQAARPRVNRLDIAQRHGGINQGGKRQQLDLVLSGVVIGDDYDDLLDKMDNISYLLDPYNGDKNITLDHRSDRYWIGRLMSEITPPQTGCTALDLELVFSVDPCAYSTTETTQTVSVTSNPDTFNVTASGATGGNMEALPVWTLQNTNATGITSVTIENTTTSEAIGATVGVPQNYYIRFDTNRQVVEVSSDGSDWTASMSSLSSTDKTFPTLKPRVQNAISITGVSTGTLTIVYRDRY